jgi:hypothetical protein
MNWKKILIDLGHDPKDVETYPSVLTGDGDHVYCDNCESFFYCGGYFAKACVIYGCEEGGKNFTVYYDDTTHAWKPLKCNEIIIKNIIE